MSNPGARPNILLIVTDQQRWDTIAGRSGCRTPRVNALARDGLLFDRSYTPVSLCCPARAMLQSGAYPWHNGVLNQVHVASAARTGMFEGTVTCAQRLADAGYQTGYVGKWHADYTKGPLDYGYQRCSAPFGYAKPVKARSQFTREDLYEHYEPGKRITCVKQRNVQWVAGPTFALWENWDGPLEGRQMAFVAARAAKMLGEFAQNDQPWLLEAHFCEPHNTFAPHVEYARRYDAAAMELPVCFGEQYVNKPGLSRREAANYREVTEADARDAIAAYWAYNEELDAQVGVILDALDRAGQADNTLVVVTSDHGEMLGDHGMYTKGWMPYEQTYRIPMAARWPGHIAPGRTTSDLVQLHDWAHSFCDVAGAQALPHADGMSLAPLFDGKRAEPLRNAILNCYHGASFLLTQRMVITRRHKYVFNGFDEDELYDLDAVPLERDNLLADTAHEATANAMRRRLYGLMKQFDDPLQAPRKHQALYYLPTGE